MKITKSFRADAPPDEVWQLMCDVSAVAECIPGFELTKEISPGVYDGHFKVRVGPITAKRAGQGSLDTDEEKRIGRVEGKGVDRRGGSRASGTLEYRVSAAAGGTEVSIDADVQLTGPLAQVGRTGIVQDIADQLTTEFAANLEERLKNAAAPAPDQPDAPAQNGAAAEAKPSSPRQRSSASEFDAGSAFWSSLWRRIAAFFGRKR